MFKFIFKVKDLFDFEKFQDEVRKIGTVLISAGALALAIDNPKNPVDPHEALLAILMGIILVFIGALSIRLESQEGVK
jgi:hypothetical protein